MSTNDHLAVLLPGEVADMLGIHRTTLYRLWRKGTGPAYVQVSSGRRRCSVASVHAFGLTSQNFAGRVNSLGSRV